MKLRKIVSCLALITMILSQTALAADALESVTSGAGKTKFDALLQAWTVNDTTATTGPKFDFKLRRAEIKFSGSVAENSRWFVMIDPAKALTTGAIAATNDNKILQDLGVAFKLCPELELVAGQFKIPTTAEGLDPSGELLFPERSFVGRNYGDKREPGLMLQWSKDIWKVSGMIFNGQFKSNVDDVDNDKDLAFRVDVAPIEMLKVGAWTQLGNYSYKTKGRWGANARATYENLLVRGEFVHTQDSGVIANGWSADAGYTLTELFQPVVRVDSYSTPTFTGTAVNLGVNYYLSKHNAKVQAAYGIMDNMSGGLGTYVPANGVNGGVFVLAFQGMI